MENTSKEKKRIVRNLVIFAVIVLGCGFAGMALDRLSPPQDSMQGLGALVWLVSPLAANVLLRSVGGDGWKDFGLLPGLTAGWMGYLAALVIVPLVTLAALAVGALAGVSSLAGLSEQGLNAYLPLVGGMFLAVMVKNVFEEFAWRGYLTPRFEALKLHPIANSVLTGLIWAGWHVPYYLYFLNRAELQVYSSLNLQAFILMAFLLLPIQALAYGELRLLSKSIWPAWLLHNISNAVSLPLLAGGFVSVNGGFGGVFFSPGPEGVLYSLLFGLVGYGLYRYRSLLNLARLRC